MGLAPMGDTPQIPQAEVTFHLAFSPATSRFARLTSEDAFRAAVAEWQLLTPQQARFRLLPNDTRPGVANFEVRIGPETIVNNTSVLGYYDGHYTKDRTKIYGSILLITESGHWANTRVDMDFWDYKFVAMHELGHLLGLGHHLCPHGIMSYFDHDAIYGLLRTCPTPDEIRDVKEHRVGLATEVDALRSRR